MQFVFTFRTRANKTNKQLNKTKFYFFGLVFIFALSLKTSQWWVSLVLTFFCGAFRCSTQPNPSQTSLSTHRIWRDTFVIVYLDGRLSFHSLFPFQIHYVSTDRQTGRQMDGRICYKAKKKVLSWYRQHSKFHCKDRNK